MAVLAGSVAAGCGDNLQSEGERAVRAYCEALVIAYRTSDADAVRPVTTEREWRKLFTLIDLKRAAGLVLESELESLTVTAVEQPGPGVLTVAATERWRYFDRPVELGRPPGTEFVVEMDLVYSFVDKDGVWKMDEATTRRHEYIEPDGYHPDEQQSRDTASQPGSREERSDRHHRLCSRLRLRLLGGNGFRRRLSRCPGGRPQAPPLSSVSSNGRFSGSESRASSWSSPPEPAALLRTSTNITDRKPNASGAGF